MTGPAEVLIPMTLILTVGAIFISRGFIRSEIGRALAHRIRGGTGGDDETMMQLSELRDEVANLRRELSETQERLDFAERVLAQGRPAEQLPKG